MNYNTVFAPTAAANRFISAHRLNLSTYFLVAAVIVLTVVSNALSFIATHYERRQEYRLITQLFIVRTQRRVVRFAIAAERTRLNLVADYQAFADRTAKRRRIASANVRAIAIRLSNFMDAVFCLG